jgi:dTMP kinase
MARRGAFIVFEGIDGSGKSTHIRLLCSELKQQGYSVLRTSEPSQGRIGRFIREYVEHRRSRLPPEIEALLFAADRFEHVKRIIEPALERGRLVISDRYLHSSLAYQGAEGVSLEWIRELNRFTLRPDLCILLDVRPETGLGRMRRRRRTVFEVYTFQQRVRNLYLQFAEQDELERVDADRPVAEVQRDISALVKGLLSGRGAPPQP